MCVCVCVRERERAREYECVLEVLAPVGLDGLDGGGLESGEERGR